MKKYLEITADPNDADYVTERTVVTDEQLEAIKPVIEAIKNCKADHNWETGEMKADCTPQKLYVDIGILSKDQIKLFDNFLPYSEYGIHTIESVKLLVVQEEIDLL